MTTRTARAATRRPHVSCRDSGSKMFARRPLCIATVYPPAGPPSIIARSAVLQSFERLLQALDGAEHARLDRADRNAQDLGDLGVFEAVVLGEQEHLPLTFG